MPQRTGYPDPQCPVRTPEVPGTPLLLILLPAATLSCLQSNAVLMNNFTVTLRDIIVDQARKTSGQSVPFFSGVRAVAALLCRTRPAQPACADDQAVLTATQQLLACSPYVV
jgi:hypothetical protein